MKRLQWFDARGYLRQALVREEDTLEMAQRGQGLPADPPDVEDIDWEVVRRNLHNALAQYHLTTLEQVNHSTAPLSSVCNKALKAEILRLYQRKGQGGSR